MSAPFPCLDRMFYVYALTDPRKDNQPFYIGKGHGRRAMSHLLPSGCLRNTYKTGVIKAIRKEGLEPGVQILEENLTEEIAFEREKVLISQYGRRIDGTGCLTNLTLGGDGTSGHKHTSETKEKMRKPKNRVLPAHPQTPETRDKISKSLEGKPGRATGYRWTEEQKARLSERRMGQKCPTKGKRRVYREDGSFYFE